ncbi:hypothetical protein CVT91_15540 [Candidatus Atribacteria bacterium HGW-Atribacteria-1]|nr:MAG: hypothetical protein CVT91_15540 [Candidatus Atribacteria bacterium HGW-Atribacteria-1]
MSKLKRMSGKEVVSILKKFGFREIRQKGSHIILKRTTSEEEIGCVIPLHSELAIGTLRGILRQAKVNIEEFMRKL